MSAEQINNECRLNGLPIDEHSLNRLSRIIRSKRVK